MDLQGRSAIVTGGAGGLGAATVRHLVALGAGVAVFDRDGERAGELAKELGDVALAVPGDVHDDDAWAPPSGPLGRSGQLSIVVMAAPRRFGGHVERPPMLASDGSEVMRTTVPLSVRIGVPPAGSGPVVRAVAAALHLVSPAAVRSAREQWRG